MLKLLEKSKANLRKKTKYTVNHRSAMKEMRVIVLHTLDTVQKQEHDVKPVNIKVLPEREK